MITRPPLVSGFLCHHCSYAAADRAGQSKLALPPEFLPVRVACTGRLSPDHLLEAFRAGADGVLVLGCHPQDCHYRSGNLRARALITLTARLLASVGLPAERLRLEWVSASEDQRLVQVVHEFTAAIRELGPLCVESREKEQDA